MTLYIDWGDYTNYPSCDKVPDKSNIRKERIEEKREGRKKGRKRRGRSLHLR